MENAQIADKLDQIADLIDLRDGNPFRIRSYRQAAQTVRDLPRRVEDMIEEGENLSRLPHIGASIADKLRELVETGTCRRLEMLRREVPESLTEILQVPQLGPRRAMQLHEAIGVSSLEDLERAAAAHEVRDVEGFGEKSEEGILAGLHALQSGAAGRFLLHEAGHHVSALERYLDEAAAIDEWAIAGSFRRRKETVGDLDILVLAADRARAVEALVAYDRVAEVMGRGREKVSVRLDGGLQVDFRFFERRSFGAALVYFTGSKAHNIALRRRCQERGWKLNEYGLFKGEHLLAGRDEAAVYHRLGLSWIPPELREDRGEVDAAAEDALPQLVEPGDLRGDLHSHTDATDGAASIEAMADAAVERGYGYLAITDHSQRVTVAHGLDEKRLRRHAERVREIDAGRDDLWLLAGVEVDVLEDGELDLAADCLAELDWVIASVHYRRAQGEQAMTERLLAAIESGVVDCIGHPLGRLIGRREPIAFDLDRVLSACAEHGVRLEIDAQPRRLDLPDTLCRRAKALGVGFVVDSDAHKPRDLDLVGLGVDVARRGWLEADDVLNTRPGRELRRMLGR